MLTTPEAVWNELGHDIAPEGDVVAHIARASAMVETYCDRRFAVERFHETIRNRPHGGPLLPRHWPVVRVIACTSDGKAVDPDEIELTGGMFVRLKGWGREVGVVYDAGFILPGEEGRTLPYDVEAVAIALVAHTLRMRDRDQTIRSDAIEGVGSTTYETGGGTIGAILAPLARYRVPTVA